MRTMMNGREFDVPVSSDGVVEVDVVRRAGGIPTGRAIVKQNPDGSNEMLNPGQMVPVKQGDHFIDMSLHERGLLQ